MAMSSTSQLGYHAYTNLAALKLARTSFTTEQEFTYTFQNFFHPFVDDLIRQLNIESLPGMLDPVFLEGLAQTLPAVPAVPAADTLFAWFKDFYSKASEPARVRIEGFPKEIDVRESGPYANYNWELHFHIPLTVAVHLSKNQRFAEAMRWFHYVFDPTDNDTSVPAPRRFWKFLAFRRPTEPTQIDELLALLSKPETECTPTEKETRNQVLAGYRAIQNKPFQPHAVARSRHLAYQYCAVMKYLDNLIAWGDSLFQQDTVESINEATQRYVLAANLLGARPQRIPAPSSAVPKTFALLRAQGLDAMGNALVELEGKFPYNFGAPQTLGTQPDAPDPLFGIGRTLYFCVPRNDKLLAYWDTVADRLFKIRHCTNIQGIVRQLALFDPPLDPGMLVKAAAAGIDIGSVVAGVNQPIGSARCLFVMQKALELCAEVRSLGGALLSAIEKGDGERMALLRQGHEIRISQMQQAVRFQQWKQAQESTETLLRGRASAVERYRHYRRLLGLPPEKAAAPDTLPLDRRELTEENFDETYAALVSQYDKAVPLQAYAPLRLAGGASPTGQSGAAGSGSLYLTASENADLNIHSPKAQEEQEAAWAMKQIAPILGLIPQFPIHIQFWGLGGEIQFGGEQLSKAAEIASDILTQLAAMESYSATRASKTSSFERRADDWILQANAAAKELVQMGRQVIGLLIAEQIAHKEYLSVQKQIEHSQEVDRFLHDKFSNEDLYAWMQGELSRLYYEYYRFAFDTARKAEQTMKRELMRPEVDDTDFVKFNYWDGGRKGLLSGEALHLDLKRLEMAYHDNNRRELELTRHVSLRQLDPAALLTLKWTGSCELTIPEWLFDLDGPGHYMRRIKTVSVSIPSVVGSYTSVSCTLSLLKSSVRKSSIAGDDYARQGSEDDRFVDYSGAVQSIVTSSGQNDSGLFETNLRDERFLPFEGAGAVSAWKLDLPKHYRAFDYATISDVLLHVRYTARQGVDPTKVKTALDALFAEASHANLTLLYSLRHDFPTEWAAFTSGTEDFKAEIRRDHFPYFTQGKDVTINRIELYGPDGTSAPKRHAVGTQAVWDSATANLNDESKESFGVLAAADPAGPTQILARIRGAQVFLAIRYTM
jgi:hypothetical protein